MGSAAEDVEGVVEKILDGKGVEVSELEADAVQEVVLRKTVCYIVSAVIFNSKGEVLMVQEAKRTCYGHWYLPAGRMEEGESIEEALQREVKEEAGLDCQPLTMVLVEEHGPQWIRFTFLAEVTGGTLKTPAEADSESLQAQWWNREDPLPLRSRDILPLINAGLRYLQKPWFPVSHPLDVPCPVVCQRMLLIFTSTCSSPENGDKVRLWLLLADVETHPRLPVMVSDSKAPSINWATYKLIRECMAASYRTVGCNTCGLLSVQHNGTVHGKTDGVCFNTLATLERLGEEESGTDLLTPPAIENGSYRWHEVKDQNLKMKILQRTKDRSLLPLCGV